MYMLHYKILKWANQVEMQLLSHILIGICSMFLAFQKVFLFLLRIFKVRVFVKFCK